MEQKEYTATWHNSLSEIGVTKSAWNVLFKGQFIFKHYDFMRGIEQSNLQYVQVKYLTIHFKNTLVAAIPCFNYKLEMDVLAGSFVKKIVRAVRKVFPNFFVLNLFGIGSPVATCENHISLNKKGIIPVQDEEAVGALIFEELVKMYKKHNASVMMVKEIPHNELAYFKHLFKDHFHLFESLPNSYVPLFKETLPYPGMLVKKYRQRIKRAYQKVENATYNWQIVKDFDDLAPEVCRLYLNVYHNSETKFERLTPDFFKQMNHLDENSYLLTCRDAQNRLICAELIIEQEEALMPMYLGLDYTHTRDSEIYSNVIYRTLKIAEEKNKKWIVFGQTSYQAKAYSGALFERLYLAIYSDRPFVKLLIRHVFKYLFPTFVRPKVNAIQTEMAKSDWFQTRLQEAGKIFE
jgi:hypothetical protein